MRTNLYGAIAGIIPALLLSVAMLISAFHYNVAQAKSRSAVAVACGKELKKQCSGVAVAANNMLECLESSFQKMRWIGAQCCAHVCDRGAVQLCQGVVAGQDNILGCLITAKGSVSSQCNAAIDACFPALAKD